MPSSFLVVASKRMRSRGEGKKKRRKSASSGIGRKRDAGGEAASAALPPRAYYRRQGGTFPAFVAELNEPTCSVLTLSSRHVTFTSRQRVTCLPVALLLLTAERWLVCLAPPRRALV